MLTTFNSLLIQRAAAMGLSISDSQAAQFARYHALLTQANARMNLTRVPEDAAEAIDRNYLDCAAPLLGAFPEARTAIDVGSGAGFPGVPLAILRPDIRFTLLDAQDKRVKFLQSVIDALGLNAEAAHGRAEDAARRPELRERFDLAVARAVAPMAVLGEYLLPFVREGGWMLAMKGPGLDGELREAACAIETLGGTVDRVEALAIPGRDWDHRAAWIRKTKKTPEKYPRRAGLPEKRPL